uniref:FAD-dependent oxidoreductase n=1 Tax=Nocardioides sp. TaxID=35761 RepID=UPI0035141B3D
MSTECDLVVLGLGPGGEALATGAARAGLRVVAVDKHLVGGECPYYGCIPSKMMVRAADLLAEAGRVDGAAGETSVTASWAPVARRIAEEATTHWDDQVAVDRLADAGATGLHGTGRLAGPGVVEVTAPDGSVST